MSAEVRDFLIEKIGEEKYHKGNISIYTTIDKEIQEIVEKALEKAAFTYETKDSPWKGPVGTNKTELDLKIFDNFNDYIPALIKKADGSYVTNDSKGILDLENKKKYENIKKNRTWRFDIFA